MMKINFDNLVKTSEILTHSMVRVGGDGDKGVGIG